MYSKNAVFVTKSKYNKIIQKRLSLLLTIKTCVCTNKNPPFSIYNTNKYEQFYKSLVSYTNRYKKKISFSKFEKTKHIL